MGTGEMVTVVDTPGFGDSDGEDNSLIDNLIKYLKNELKSTTVFLILLKKDDRLNWSTQRMLREISIMFGNKFWERAALGFSRWSFRQIDIEDREAE